MFIISICLFFSLFAIIIWWWIKLYMISLQLLMMTHRSRPCCCVSSNNGRHFILRAVDTQARMRSRHRRATSGHARRWCAVSAIMPALRSNAHAWSSYCVLPSGSAQRPIDERQHGCLSRTWHRTLRYLGLKWIMSIILSSIQPPSLAPRMIRRIITHPSPFNSLLNVFSSLTNFFI